MNDFVFYLLLLVTAGSTVGILYLLVGGLLTWINRSRDLPEIRWWRRRVAELHIEYFGHDQIRREPGRHRLKPTRGRYHLRVPCRELMAGLGL
jgi:hypothetical protein